MNTALIRSLRAVAIASLLLGGYPITTALATSAPQGQQTAVAAQPQGGPGRGGRGGLPGATLEQTQALAEMTAALAAKAATAAAARTELGTVALSEVTNSGRLNSAAEKLRAAELDLATARAEAFAQLQSGPNKLNAEQVAALVAAGGSVQAGRGAPPAGAARGRGGN